MLSQTAEYALRAMTCLGSEPGKPRTNRLLAQQCSVPSGYLSKVMQALGRAGLVRSTRGLHGGFLITRLPVEITILEILQAVDPLKRINACPLGNAKHKGKLCPLHRRLDRAIALVEKAFSETTLADVLSDEHTLYPQGMCSNR